MNNLKYPIYIISKGRWENPLTAKFLMKENIPFWIVVEPQEYEKYKTTIPEENIKVLPFSNLGLGSFPARNWCWEDSIELGYERHFLFDDNIRGFMKFKNKRISGEFTYEALTTLIKLTESYENVAISGFEYSGFVIPQSCNKPFKYNVHVYSCMLILNKIPYRWRLKYNEDVDLCLQVLHDKYCTISLNYYCQQKTSTTAKMKGGNQSELYLNNNENKKLLKVKSLEMVWPQYVETTVRFNRPHHFVNWKKHFKHNLIKKIEK